MAFSIFNSANRQPLEVRTNCDQDTCEPIGDRGGRAFRNLGAIIRPQGGGLITSDFLEPFQIPSVAVIGQDRFYRVINNFLPIQASALQVYQNNASYGTSQANYLASNYSSSIVAVANTGTTALPSITLNADYNPSGVANQRTKQFAVLANLRVPDTVYKVVIGRTGAAGPVTENLTVDFTTLDCRELGLIAITTAQRYLSVANPTAPIDRNSYALSLPVSFNDTEAPGSGGILTLNIQCFDETGAQVAANVQVETWNVPYGNGLIGSIISTDGVPNGLRTRTLNGTRPVDIVNTQVTL